MSLAGQVFTSFRDSDSNSTQISYQEDKQESEVAVQCFRLEGTSTTSAPEQVMEPEVAGSAILSPAQEAEPWDTRCPTPVITTAIKRTLWVKQCENREGRERAREPMLSYKRGRRRRSVRALRLSTRQIKCWGRWGECNVTSRTKEEAPINSRDLPGMFPHIWKTVPPN